MRRFSSPSARYAEMPSKSEPLFYEEQPFRQLRLRILTAIPPVVMTLLAIWQVGLGHRWGKQPMSNGSVIGWAVFLWLIYLDYRNAGHGTSSGRVAHSDARALALVPNSTEQGEISRCRHRRCGARLGRLWNQIHQPGNGLPRRGRPGGGTRNDERRSDSDRLAPANWRAQLVNRWQAVARRPRGTDPPCLLRHKFLNHKNKMLLRSRSDSRRAREIHLFCGFDSGWTVRIGWL